MFFYCYYQPVLDRFRSRSSPLALAYEPTVVIELLEKLSVSLHSGVDLSLAFPAKHPGPLGSRLLLPAHYTCSHRFILPSFLLIRILFPGIIPDHRNSSQILVEQAGLEPATSSLRTRRSPVELLPHGFKVHSNDLGRCSGIFTPGTGLEPAFLRFASGAYFLRLPFSTSD